MGSVQKTIFAAAALTLLGLPTIGGVVWRALEESARARADMAAIDDEIWRYEIAGREIVTAFWRAISLQDAPSREQLDRAVAARGVLADKLIAKGFRMGFTAETRRVQAAIYATRNNFNPVIDNLRSGNVAAAIQQSPARDPKLMALSRELREATRALQQAMRANALKQAEKARNLMVALFAGGLAVIAMLAALWAAAFRGLMKTSHALRAARQELEDQAGALERTVAERTADLGRAQKELSAAFDGMQRQKDLLASMSEVANTGGWEFDILARTFQWTDQARRIHEAPEDFEAILCTDNRCFAGEARAAMAAAVARAKETGEGWDLELPMRTFTGREIYIRSVGRAVMLDGRTVRIVGAIQDVTEQRQRRVKLQEALDQLAGFFEVSLDLLCVGSLDGRYLRVSHAFEKVLGHPRAHLEGAMVLDFIHPDDHASSIEVLGALASGGDVAHYVNRVRTADGRYRDLEWRASPANGVIYAAARDITESLARQREVEEARAAAEAANQAKSVFLANMSHEIRTPLNGVVGLAGALSRTPLAQRQQEMVQLIQASGETLERLLCDILDVSKVEAGKLTLEIAPFALRETVETAAEILRVRADEKGIGFKVQFDPEAEGWFEGDAVRVRQIVANLASNAVKFTHQGHVSVRVRADDGGVTIDVVDTGIGFDAEAANRLFSRFEQADGSITRRFGGSGLGLSISQALVDLMGGEISAVSAPGAGSTFTVRLPLARVSAPARVVGAYTELLPTEHMGADASPVRVLLAEDHPTNQRVATLILEPHGVEVTIANNGLEAFEIARTAAFDAILMDMQMPEMDGLGATRAIRAWEAAEGRPRTPIAMLSANAMNEHVAMALAAGCDLHIAKPVTPAGLIAGLSALLALAPESANEAEEALSA